MSLNLTQNGLADRSVIEAIFKWNDGRSEYHVGRSDAFHRLHRLIEDQGIDLSEYRDCIFPADDAEYADEDAALSLHLASEAKRLLKRIDAGDVVLVLHVPFQDADLAGDLKEACIDFMGKTVQEDDLFPMCQQYNGILLAPLDDETNHVEIYAAYPDKATMLTSKLSWNGPSQPPL